MTVYTTEEAIHVTSSGKKMSNKCRFVEYYYHPQKLALRKACDTLLMRKVKGFKGDEYMYPRHSSCFQSLIQSLDCLITRAGFLSK